MVQDNRRIYYAGSKASWFSLSTYHVGSGPGAYMFRYICSMLWGSVRLHHIMRSDADQHLHDHPLDLWVFLLGSYTEELPDPSREVRPVYTETPEQETERLTRTRLYRRARFSFRHIPAEQAHRLILTKPVWTIVVTGPVRRRWGFYVGGFEARHWVDSKTYLAGGSRQ